MYSIFLLVLFSAYILWDYFFNTKNKYKLFFIVPIILSIPLLTNLPSMMSATVFAIYRIGLIIICFVVMWLYLKDIGRRKKELLNKQNKANKKK